MSKAAASQDDRRDSGPGILPLYALTPGDAFWNRAVSARIGHIGDVWPITILGHVVALAAATSFAFAAAPAGSLLMLLGIGAANLLLLVVQGCMLWAHATRSLAVHIQVRIALVLNSALGAGIVAFHTQAGTVLGGPALVAEEIALGGSAILIAISLASVPAPLGGFLIAIVAGSVIAAQSLSAAITAAAMFPLAMALAWCSARGDLRMQRGRTRSESDRQRATRLVSTFEAHGSGWFWETDREGRLRYLSPGLLQFVDRPDRPAIGAHLTEIFQLDSAGAETERSLNFHLSGRTSFTDYSVRAIEGVGVRDKCWSMSGRPLADEIGQFSGFVGSGGDLTERRRADAEISRMALFDGLTGLANRQRMRLALDKALAPPNGTYGTASLFLLDLDRFKAVNDTLGHQVGDALLKQVAMRLQRAVGEAGLVGRLGGDEFEVVLAGEIDRDRLSVLASAIIGALSAPYTINGGAISIGCSLGIALAPADGRDSETLIRNADLALYAAKAEGRGIHRFYRPQLLLAAQNRRQLEDDLRTAFAQAQFYLTYQPVVSTQDTRVVGYEALVRWDHPERGAISPTEFIPIAEECGLIEQIGEWVLRTACATAATWPENVRVAVNVSPIQFANPALPALVASALAHSGLTAGRLELEITEGVFLGESNATDRMFASLKGLGVRLALDDFGTGYSSLGYLKQAPFDKIKIDQSFVRGAAIQGSRNAAIIRAIVALADTLGMETTAEGVELQDEIALIRELGCSHIQGYVYGKPVAAEEVARQLHAAGNAVEASGFRTSRTPRIAMLRTAIIEVDGLRQIARIRNITANGAMIDSIGKLAPGAPLTIEIFPGEPVPAQVQWMRDSKAGIRFARPIELDRLIAAVDTIIRQVA